MTGRFLKTIRFDGSDAHAYPLAADPDEWAISGAFAFHDLGPDSLTGKTRQAFANGLLGLDTFGRATFAAVASMSDADRTAITGRLARHLTDTYGAPSSDAALEAAGAEIAFIEDLTEGVPINTLFCVSRELDAGGDIVENFRKLERRISGGPIYLGDEDAT